MLQEVAGDHSALLGTDRESLMQKNLFWAVIRHRVQITRLPGKNEKITVQTWPMPTTCTSYPRSTVAYDEAGNECFRGISLWVLMDAGSRAMVLPGKSGVTVSGMLTGSELAIPGSMALQNAPQQMQRTVRYSDLDVNGHMNNCRYMDWVADTLPGSFHASHRVSEFTVNYLSEAREGEDLRLQFQLADGPCLGVDALREDAASTGHERVFSARVLFDGGVL
jgi:acyl-ACP thioesterase